MPEEKKPDDKPDAKPDDDADETKPDPDSGAKSALERERKARRDADRRATEAERRAKELEDKDKTEVQRLTDENADLKKQLATVTVSSARLKVAIEKGLTATQAKRLVGDTEEDLAADADELLADLGAKPGGGDKPDGDETKPPPAGGKPREQLKPGSGNPDVPVEETDIKKLGARMFES